MAENKRRILNEVKVKLVNSQLDDALSLIFQAAGHSAQKTDSDYFDNIPQKFYGAARNPLIHEMLLMYRAFRTAHAAFDTEDGTDPSGAEKTQKYMAEILPKMDKYGKTAVNYWLGRCAQYLEPDDEMKAAAYFKAAIKDSPFKNNSIYLRLASRELYRSSAPAREKLEYMETGYKKLAVQSDVGVYERCMDTLRRKAYNEYTAEARFPETPYERREECLLEALKLLKDIKFTKRERLYHSKCVYDAMYYLYSKNGDTEKAGKAAIKRQSTIYAMAKMKKQKESFRVYNHGNYR